MQCNEDCATLCTSSAGQTASSSSVRAVPRRSAEEKEPRPCCDDAHSHVQHEKRLGKPAVWKQLPRHSQLCQYSSQPNTTKKSAIWRWPGAILWCQHVPTRCSEHGVDDVLAYSTVSFASFSFSSKWKHVAYEEAYPHLYGPATSTQKHTVSNQGSKYWSASLQLTDRHPQHMWPWSATSSFCCSTAVQAIRLPSYHSQCRFSNAAVPVRFPS